MISGEAAPILLGLLSAVTLAAVNIAVKAGEDIFMGRIILAGSAGVLVIPIAFFVPFPSPTVMVALLWSCLAHGIYQFSIIRGMQSGDLSVVFPIMRGAAPVGVALLAVLVLGEGLPVHAWLGLIVASAGVIAFVAPSPVTAGTVPTPRAVFWSIMTSIGIALYSVADARGVRLAAEPLTYIVWLFLFEAIWMTLVGVAIRRKDIVAGYKALWRHGVFAGIGSIVSFGALLLALDLTNVAQASALRETSVIFSAVMASVVLHEPFGKRRILGALVVTVGLLLLQI